MIHILTGEGAGKTTSSIGHLIRSIGHEGKGLIIQFYKNDKNAGDYKFFFDQHQEASVDIIQYGVRCVNENARDKCENCGKCMGDPGNLRRRVLSGIKKLQQNHRGYDSIVLDEILVAYSFGHITEDEIKEIICLSEDKEWYLTGRLWVEDGCVIYDNIIPPWVLNWADYITLMVEIKHPFQKGVKHRKGVEW